MRSAHSAVGEIAFDPFLWARQERERDVDECTNNQDELEVWEKQVCY